MDELKQSDVLDKCMVIESLKGERYEEGDKRVWPFGKGVGRGHIDVIRHPDTKEPTLIPNVSLFNIRSIADGEQFRDAMSEALELAHQMRESA